MIYSRYWGGENSVLKEICDLSLLRSLISYKYVTANILISDLTIEHSLPSKTLLQLIIYIYIYIYIYDVVKSKRRHWLAVTLSFTPCGDRQTDFYKRIKVCLTIATRRETQSYSKPMPPF